MSAEKVIAAARGDLGYTEFPAGSNRTKYGEAYGWNGVPWCVQAVWFWFREAGESAAFFGGAKTSSCGTLLRWFREQGQVVSAEDAQPGDIVMLNFRGGAQPEHCGIVLGINSQDDSYINTIEGNTSPGYEGSQDNGGCVALKHRYRSQIVAVCRPKYKEEPMSDWEKHWAEEDIRWSVDNGLMQGYPDGTFRPDEPITRAQLAVVLHRYDNAFRQEVAKMMEDFRR